MNGGRAGEYPVNLDCDDGTVTTHDKAVRHKWPAGITCY